MTSAPFPKFALPGEALEWMRHSNVESCEPLFKDASPDGPPSVTLVRKTDASVAVARAWSHCMKDGPHYFITASPGSSGATVQLAFRKAAVRDMKMSATAGLAAVFALRFHKRSALSGFATADPVAERDWLRRAHGQVLKALQKHGAEALTGMGPVFLKFTRESLRLIDRVTGKDVEEAVARVRKDFSFLQDHLDEEAVITLWREALVDKTHDR